MLLQGGIAAKLARAGTEVASVKVRSVGWIPALPSVWMPGALLAVVAAVVGVYLPVLRHSYFFADDFVPLGDIAKQSTWSYLREIFLLRDVTPNWRVLPGLYYLVLFKAFGLNETAFLLGSVLAQAATAGLIFWLVWRVVHRVWPATLAGLLFGINAAHVPTVAYITAFTHVLGGLLVVLAVVLLYEGLERQQLSVLVSVSVIAFGGAIAANESVAVVAPVFGLLAFWKTSTADGWRCQCTRAAWLSLPYVLLGASALATFSACRCTDAPELMGFGNHIIGNTWIFLGRLLYPIGMEFPPGRVDTSHLVAGIVLAVLTAVALLRGPGLARISAVFLILALVPYLPMDWVVAPRHVYLASIPFAIMMTLLAVDLTELAGRLAPALAAALVVVAFGAVGLLGWQTVEQNRPLDADSNDWRTLVDGLQERYPDVPDGSLVYVRGGPLTSTFWQPYVLPALAEVLWGDVELSTVPESTVAFCSRTGHETYVVDFDDGRFTPVDLRDASALARSSTGGTPRASLVECSLEQVLPP